MNADRRRRPGIAQAVDAAQHLERRRERRLHEAATRLALEQGLRHRGLAACAHQLEMTEPRPAQHFGVARQPLRKRITDTVAMRPGAHADEIDDDRAGEIAQADLPRHFLGRGEIDREDRAGGFGPRDAALPPSTSMSVAAAVMSMVSSPPPDRATRGASAAATSAPTPSCSKSGTASRCNATRSM